MTVESNEWSSGPENAVPCPWCGGKNDHTMIKDIGGRETHAKSGLDISCDHCEKHYIIKRIDLRPTVWVSQFDPEEDKNND